MSVSKNLQVPLLQGLIMEITESQPSTFVKGIVDSFINNLDMEPVNSIPFTNTTIDHLTFGSLQSNTSCQFHGSPWNSENLEGVGSIEQIDWDWDDVMSFYRSMQQDSLPCGVDSGSAAGLESGYEEINPKKKRRRLEQGEGSCKRCKCKKSKCLMLYCGCFAAGVYCTGPCECINCFNQPIHKDTLVAARKQIESRKPLAFAPNAIRWWDSLPEIGDDFRTSRGCSCKKGCQMKYCKCYEGGVGCSFNCRCDGCKNKFGTKEKSPSAASNGPPPISATPSTTTTTSSSVLADKKAELDQSFVSNVAPGSTSYGFGWSPDNNLQDFSLLANVSDFPVFGQQMTSSTPSAFGFASHPNPFMFDGHQDSAAAVPLFHHWT